MKNLLLLFFMLTTFSVFGQRKVQVADDVRLQTAIREANVRQFDGTESLEGRPIRKSIHQTYLEEYGVPTQIEDVNREIWIGTTFYDLQTNGAGQNRVSGEDLNSIRAVWTHHNTTEDGGFPDRGTGFAESNPDGSFPFPTDIPTLEEPRTGWPNLVRLPDGTDVVVCHLPAATNDLVMLRRAPGDNVWEESRISTDVPFGLLWPQLAIGENGTLHMICVSTPPGNGGEIFEGLSPALLYFRSLDGGLTFDISDQILPGLGAPDPGTPDDLNFGVGGDSYQLEADENGNVAIVLFDAREDITLFKSSDNGTTFERKVVSALPFDDYIFSTIPYTIEDLGGIDPNGPGAIEPIDSSSAAALSFLTSDGSGSVALDAAGNAHVVFPQMYVSAADTTVADGAFTFFPFFGDLIYWNEITETISRIDGVFDALDTNQDTVLNFTDFNNFADHNGNMFISMPSVEVLDDGRIVVAYTAAMEELIRVDELNVNPMQHYTHVWMTGSNDNGATWVDPVDMIAEEFVLFGALVSTTDAVFPNTQVVADNLISLNYQFDMEPGLNLVMAEEDPIVPNTIAVNTIDVETVLGLEGVVSTTSVAPEIFNFKVSPNPATGFTSINFELDQSESVTIDLYNVVGSLVSQSDLGNVTTGEYNQNLNLDNLSPGIYMVSLRAGDKVATQRLVVTK